MKVPKLLLNIAAELGADIEIIPHPEDRANYTIEVTAPDGYLWEESGGVSLVSRFWTYVKGNKEEAIQDIVNRMKLGIYADPEY